MKSNFFQVSGTKTEDGFSLFESVIASMISLIFISLGANLVIAANMQKALAKRNSIMNDYIQSDIDGIAYQGSILTKASETVDPTTGESPHTLACKASVTATNGYAAALKARLGTDTPLTIKVLNRDYTMTRTTGISSEDSRLMSVSYQFTYNGSVDYKIYREVMPAVALTCPPPPPPAP